MITKECQYPGCKKKAEFTLSMADPDAEIYCYCKEYVDIVKMNTMMEVFGYGQKTARKKK